MTSSSSTAAPTSTLGEQSLTASLTAETMVDPDDGHLALIAYREGNAGDLREVSPARLLGMVDAERKRLDDIERLAKVFEAEDTLAAILAEHRAEMEEWDTATADDLLRENFVAAAMVTRGQMVVVVPLGQDPVVRTAAVAELINNLAEREET